MEFLISTIYGKKVFNFLEQKNDDKPKDESSPDFL